MNNCDKKKRGLTAKELEKLEIDYPRYSTKELAEMYNTTETCISSYAYRNKWRKSNAVVSHSRSICGKKGNYTRWHT